MMHAHVKGSVLRSNGDHTEIQRVPGCLIYHLQREGDDDESRSHLITSVSLGAKGKYPACFCQYLHIMCLLCRQFVRFIVDMNAEVATDESERDVQRPDLVASLVVNSDKRSRHPAAWPRDTAIEA